VTFEMRFRQIEVEEAAMFQSSTSSFCRPKFKMRLSTRNASCFSSSGIGRKSLTCRRKLEIF